MARRFFSLASILDSGRRSALFKWSASAISSVEVGAFLTCRKRSMLSELRWDGVGMRGASQRAGPAGKRILLIFFSVHTKLFLGFAGFMHRPTHGRLAALRQASRHLPERGSKGGGTTWPASHLTSIR